MVLGHSVARLLRHALSYDPDEREFWAPVGWISITFPPLPKGLPGGVPYEAFDEDDARKAMGMATRVVEYMNRAMEEMKE